MKKSQIRSRVRTLLENYMEDENLEMDTMTPDVEELDVEELYVSFMMDDEDVQSEARGRISSIFAINDEQAVLLDPSFEAASPDVRRTKIADFINRVNEIIMAKKHFAPGQKRPTKAFSKDDLTRLLALFTDEEGFTSKDIVDAVESYKTVQQANAFLKALELKRYIKLTNFDEETGKFFDPKKKSTLAPEDEFDADLKDLAGLGGDIDLSDPLMEAKQSPKFKEIEAKGKMAALEAKLEAINEMIENITSSLTRLEEDETMAAMMDKTKTKEMRKEVKLLERMKAKVEKEKSKMEGKGMKSYKSKEVMDEDTIEESINENRMDIKSKEDIKRAYEKDPDAMFFANGNFYAYTGDDLFFTDEDGEEHELNLDDIEFVDLNEVTSNLNESKSRMQKLAGIIKG